MAGERIVIGLSGGLEGEVLIRRAVKVLDSAGGGDLIAVHIRTAEGASHESTSALESQRRLAVELGGSYHTVAAHDPVEALLGFASHVGATRLVIGQSRAHPVSRLLTGATETRIIRRAGDLDVQVVPHPLAGRGTGRRRQRDLGRVRVAVGFVLAAAIPILMQLALAVIEHSVATAVLVQLAGAVAVALVGGLWPGVAGALWSSLLVNYFSTPPVGELAIKDPQDLLALGVFVGVSVAVAGVVDRSARRSKEAARARAEAATLGELARGATRAEDTVGSLLEQALDVFGVRGAALFSGPAFRNGTDSPDRPVLRDTPAFRDADAARAGENSSERKLLASAGELTDSELDGGEFAEHTVEPVDDGTWLVLFGRTVPAADSSLLGAFAAHVLAQLERQQLAASRLEVLRLAEGNTMRTAILRAVSHDLRTPLAGIKLAVGGLLQTAVTYTPEEQQELLKTIDECSDRLDALVGNLLDMSRITADSVRPLLKPVRWLDVVPPALRGLPQGSVRVVLPPNLPAVDADAVLLERVIANIAENAVKYAPASDVTVTSASGGLSGAVVNGHPAGELRIIDHGRGVPDRNVPAMFRPFQRLDDLSQSTGVGLGLAVARGFVSAMGGSLSAEETPGGGLTMVIRLPLSTGHRPTEIGSTGHEGHDGGPSAAAAVPPAVTPQETAQ
jgi:two-component system, OmpR family, sensor histidine kinase KdpD